METRWEDIFKHLEKAGFDVYPPATKKSECTKMYIVVRHAGTSSVLTVSSNRALFDLLVYVPKHEYSKIESYLNEVKNVMDELFPLHFLTMMSKAGWYLYNMKIIKSKGGDKNEKSDRNSNYRC